MKEPSEEQMMNDTMFDVVFMFTRELVTNYVNKLWRKKYSLIECH